MTKLFTALTLFLLLFSAVHATNIIQTQVPNAQIVGSATLKFFMWKIYDATLYAPAGKWQENQAFALKLVYGRTLKGKLIAKRSIEEIQQLGFNDEKTLNDWYKKMQNIFPDVQKGTELTGIYIPSQPTQFYQGSKKIGQVDNPEFGIWFFRIWLSEKSSERKMRQQLLGLS